MKIDYSSMIDGKPVVIINYATETITATSRYDGSGTPINEWNGHADCFRVVNPLKEDAFFRLVAEILPLVKCVCENYNSEWDGHNHVGVFTDKANEAMEKLNYIISEWGSKECDTFQVWEASDWFTGIGSIEAQCNALGIKESSSDDELVEIAKDAIIEAQTYHNVDAIIGCEKYIEWLHKNL